MTIPVLGHEFGHGVALRVTAVRVVAVLVVSLFIVGAELFSFGPSMAAWTLPGLTP